MRAPAFSMLAAAGVKALLNVMLVPALGISGAALAGAAAYMLAAGLNVALLARLVALRPAPGAVLAKPALVIAAMSLAALGTAWAAEAVLGGMGVAADGRLAAMGVSLLGIAAGSAVLLLAAARTGLPTAAELTAVPKSGASPGQAAAQTACAALISCSRSFCMKHSPYAIIGYRMILV
ncbi:polysaccharide biosynthesis C-terminal domain-containing protein [Paenibacillus amylolyticus]|nr:polysaccharide biosynthesis C-terminal domain-containing protein [Paenibacillus amylolyticus]WFR63663.1 polysaccharide biosynthesis C-terminal domain-containing protein [Paenibacillus amylolyticus]